MAKQDNWVDRVQEINVTAVAEKVEQLDRSLQAWTNKQLSSDLFLGWVLGYLVKGPVELLLACIVAGIVVGFGSIMATFGLAYEVTTTQALPAGVAFSVGVYSKVHCKLSNREASTQEPTPSINNGEDETENEETNVPPEVEV